MTGGRSSDPHQGGALKVAEELPTPTLSDAQQLLVHALKLLLDPHQWTRGSWARDSSASPKPPHAASAASWCAAGAIVRAEFDLHGPAGVLACTAADGYPETFDTSPRISAALRLLAPPMARICARAYHLDVSNLAGQAAELELAYRGEIAEATLVPAIVNDLPRIDHDAVISAFAVAIDVALDQLETRSY